MSWFDFAVRIALALLFGSLIGLERQWRQRRAGLRTNALVSTGSAAFVTISTMIEGDNSSTRIASQVVSGIGFLGAGVILREGLNVRGLNTAATLWCAAAVGTLAGLGFIVPSFITTAAVVGANIILRPLATKINRRKTSNGHGEIPIIYKVRITCLDHDENRVRSLLLDLLSSDDLLPNALSSETIGGSLKVQVEVEVIASGRHDRLMERVIKRLKEEPGITSLSWEVVGEEELICSIE
jgi:putative Mg2+ transporter-C (MgtC) family protein